MNPEDILLILAPPTRLIDYLERLLAIRVSKGETVPADWNKWLERWKAIRGDMASDIDYIKPEEWSEVSETVGKYVTGANDKVAQPTLLEVPTKRVYA